MIQNMKKSTCEIWTEEREQSTTKNDKKENERKKINKLKKYIYNYTQMKWSGKQDVLHREEADYLYYLKMNEQSAPIVVSRRSVKCV